MRNTNALPLAFADLRTVMSEHIFFIMASLDFEIEDRRRRTRDQLPASRMLRPKQFPLSSYNDYIMGVSFRLVQIKTDA